MHIKTRGRKGKIFKNSIYFHINEFVKLQSQSITFSSSPRKFKKKKKYARGRSVQVKLIENVALITKYGELLLLGVRRALPSEWWPSEWSVNLPWLESITLSIGAREVVWTVARERLHLLLRSNSSLAHLPPGRKVNCLGLRLG